MTAVAITRLEPRPRASPAPVVNHLRFGPLRASLRRESEAVIWECLDLIPTAHGLADLEFDAGAWGPTAAHEQQLDAILATFDCLTEAAARAISIQLGEGDPMSNLEWQGARLTGRPGEFQLHYWWTAGPELLITVSFVEWLPIAAAFHD